MNMRQLEEAGRLLRELQELQGLKRCAAIKPSQVSFVLQDTVGFNRDIGGRATLERYEVLDFLQRCIEKRLERLGQLGVEVSS